MRIEIHTKYPEALWEKIKNYIKDKKIITWALLIGESKTEYLTHLGSKKQWYKKALLKHSTKQLPTRLVLTVTWFKGFEKPDDYTRGLYVGRFVEQLLIHFRPSFTKLEILGK